MTDDEKKVFRWANYNALYHSVIAGAAPFAVLFFKNMRVYFKHYAVCLPILSLSALGALLNFQISGASSMGSLLI